ncbi:metallophosphoesterase [uncultured Tessaracoccus sp.]|uniref:metallophosphoesterase n=1 Tax=uncultured Tessaracoccus sp. TaxID=905023 RepID=UPI0026100FC2|nr:metallophosphoesterase [uncultured Tessaracoccus sp.]
MHAAVKCAGALVGAGATAFGWALAEAHLFTLRRASLPVLPPGSENIKVLHISDLHLLPRQRDKLRFVRGLASLNPDLVIDTGDNISSASAIGPLREALDGLRGVPGVFVFGSNDYQAPRFKNPLRYVTTGRSTATPDDVVPSLPTGELREALESLGWVDLTHRRHTLQLRGLTVEFRGTDDAHHDRDDYTAVAGTPAPDVDLAIGVTHAPYLRLLDAMTSDGVAAIFAGHTHGGQVCVPGYGALTTNCDLEPGRVRGASTHTVDGQTAHLHVSAGLGTSPFAPIRFACRPEASLVTLAPRG